MKPGKTLELDAEDHFGKGNLQNWLRNYLGWHGPKSLDAHSPAARLATAHRLHLV